MDKKDFIDIVRSMTDVSRSTAERTVDAVLSAMSRALEEKGEVRLTGIGRLYTILRKPYTISNSLTGNGKQEVPASWTVKLSVSGKIRELLNR